jgi:hypothetical protein
MKGRTTMSQHDNPHQPHAIVGGLRDLAAATSWYRQVELYTSFSTEQLRTLYRLRRRWLHEQSEQQLRTVRRQEFIRFLVQTGRLAG